MHVDCHSGIGEGLAASRETPREACDTDYAPAVPGQELQQCQLLVRHVQRLSTDLDPRVARSQHEPSNPNRLCVDVRRRMTT